MQRLPIIGQSTAPAAVEAVLRAAFGAAGSELQLERWERRPHLLAQAIEEVAATPEIGGALIVAPFKERAAGALSLLSPDAKTTGAVNLIRRDGDRLRGHNTDVDGIRAGLQALLPRARGQWPRTAVVLGAGGGARACVAVLIGLGLQHVAVFNRHLHRAEALVAHFARSARQMELRARPWHESVLEAELSKAGLLVNASGIGVEEGESAVAAGLVPDGLVLLDLVLDHAATPLMREVAARGGSVANGQASFLASSAATFTLLTGQAPPVEVMKRALATELGLPEDHVAVVGD
jgi:shikimate dehydrogenase